MNALPRRSVSLLVISTLAATLLLSAARAEVVPAAIFTDSMVLQRDLPVPVWGKAAPDEAVTVEFAGQKIATKADASGKWKVALKAMPASDAPREMTIAGAGAPRVLKDVLVGEVWLCSGQSNMGLEVRKALNAQEDIAKANYPAIRGFMVSATPSNDQGYPIEPVIGKLRYALTPQEKCEGAWRVCTPANVINWSGVGYFFGRNLHERLHVPVGLIMASYGATAIESWIGLEGLKSIPAYRERAISFEALAKEFIADNNSYPGSLETEKTRLAEKSRIWFEQLDAEESGLKNKWMTPALDTSKWSTVKLPVTADDNPIGEAPASNWFRKEIKVPTDWIGKELELHLGLVDGADEAYVNGVRVGRTWFDVPKYWSVSRVYPVPAAAVADLTIALRVLKTIYPMGLFGPAGDMLLKLKDAPVDAPAVSLVGEWRMAKSQDLDPAREPRPAALLNHIPGNYYGHPGVQYNGQINPLIPYAIRGAIWYQGEANAPFYTDYRSLMPGLIKSWRAEWGQDFAFGIVALADYQRQQSKPVERTGYHLIREAQAMALSVPNTFLATAVGVGEGADIHPKRKQEVGRRLALSALGTVYGEKDKPYNGPTYQSMAVEGAKIRLRFTFAPGLHAQGEPPVGFAIAGEDRTFHFAQAKIEGETVVVWSDQVPHPVAVRYAWATNPVCNLYNSEELPMLQFRTDPWDQSQLVIPEETITLPSGWVPK
ncbi:MAG TPA: sialate O-acetylesterase [Chthoniobacteraceae bacterium]|nr:sialate O-acetylesterase [Chthoniobacteraceae bacterium]